MSDPLFTVVTSKCVQLAYRQSISVFSVKPVVITSKACHRDVSSLQPFSPSPIMDLSYSKALAKGLAKQGEQLEAGFLVVTPGVTDAQQNLRGRKVMKHLKKTHDKLKQTLISRGVSPSELSQEIETDSQSDSGPGIQGVCSATVP